MARHLLYNGENNNYKNKNVLKFRLCELLIEPNKHYNRTGVFLRALEKNINVVRDLHNIIYSKNILFLKITTITEDGLRITGLFFGSTLEKF